ncbi:hypothetical protein BDM02DRAFT_3114742 [Thelephora ganbajun]|uniref:Uncharacterized protein n=1 Tax=Thelephora ganbajun TaxID=370292 RepID=A0ACB6ZGI3_THEGA|nr:hypothetical protein BDM02DRAFT_3114742 [Thelephora ganbajun]
MSEINPLGIHLLDSSLPKRRGRPSKAVIVARAAMVAAVQPKAQAQTLKKHQLALDSSSSEDDIDDLSLAAHTDRICRAKLGFDFDPFSSDDDPFRSIPSTSQLLIQDDNTSFTPSPHKLSWEDSPITYPDDDYPYEDTTAALVTRSDLDGGGGGDQDQSAPMDLEEVLHSALLAESDSQNDAQVPHNLRKWDIIPPTSFRWTREPIDLPTFSPRRYATKSLQRRIIMSAGSYYPSYPAHPHHHLHHHQPHSNHHPSKPGTKTRPLPPPLLALPASKFRGPGMYPGIAKRKSDNDHP